MRPGEMKILRVLAAHALAVTSDEGLTFTELKEATGLSAPVLSDYLTANIKMGIIIKNDETRGYKIPKGFSMPSPVQVEGGKESITIDKNIGFHGSVISIIGLGNKDLGARLFKDFLLFHMNQLSAFVVHSIRKAIKTSFEYGKQTIRTSLKHRWQEPVDILWSWKKKKPDLYAQTIIRTMEKQVDELHHSLKESLDNWVNPYIHYLALAYIANVSYDEVGVEVTKQFLETSKENVSWRTVLREEWEKWEAQAEASNEESSN